MPLVAGLFGRGEPQPGTLMRPVMMSALFVAAWLGDWAGVLIASDTGCLKKGTGSVGVQRLYSGTAGRIENSQVGAFLSHVSARGRALIDRWVYLPRSWTGDPGRCAAASVPANAGFEPTCSASAQPFLRGTWLISPATYLRAFRRGSTRTNTAPGTHQLIQIFAGQTGLFLQWRQ
jgi:hypothetical protein